jgi:hypothetical protein
VEHAPLPFFVGRPMLGSSEAGNLINHSNGFPVLPIPAPHSGRAVLYLSRLPLPQSRVRLRCPQPRTVVLATLLLATMVMPVNYRAGAEHQHSHTIFQGMIDGIAGHPHQHPGTADAPANERASKPVSPFVSAAIPLSVLVEAETAIRSDSPAISTPDSPHLLGLSAPITSTSAIIALGFLIATLLAGSIARPWWSHGRPLADWCAGEDPPPPRFA